MPGERTTNGQAGRGVAIPRGLGGRVQRGPVGFEGERGKPKGSRRNTDGQRSGWNRGGVSAAVLRSTGTEGGGGAERKRKCRSKDAGKCAYLYG